MWINYKVGKLRANIVFKNTLCWIANLLYRVYFLNQMPLLESIITTINLLKRY